MVADRLQRNAIAIDLSHDYAAMAAARYQADAGMFAEAFTSWPPAEPPDEQRQRELFREPEYGA
jgi:hypothetical protein